MNLRTITIGLLLVALSPLTAFAQDVTKPMSPEAQEAMKKGVIAAKSQDYLLAIRYFEEARKVAPEAPEIFFNLGLAESKIPSRELRAISWFGAYLTVNPNASNAPAIWSAIEELQVKSRGNTLRLIRLLRDTTDKMSSERNLMGSTPRTYWLAGVAGLYVRAGETNQAISLAKAIRSGDAWIAVGRAQLKNGDKEGARASLAEAIRNEPGDANIPQFRDELSNGLAPPSAPPETVNITVRGWIDMLDESQEESCNFRCPLNTPIFLDLPAHLRSMSSSNSFEVASQLYHAADLILDAGAEIDKRIKALPRR